MDKLGESRWALLGSMIWDNMWANVLDNVGDNVWSSVYDDIGVNANFDVSRIAMALVIEELHG